jgi:hypothetical protein
LRSQWTSLRRTLLNISANFTLSSLHEFGSRRTAFVANQMRLVRDQNIVTRSPEQVTRDLFCQCPLGMNSAASLPTIFATRFCRLWIFAILIVADRRVARALLRSAE